MSLNKKVSRIQKTNLFTLAKSVGFLSYNIIVKWESKSECYVQWNHSWLKAALAGGRLRNYSEKTYPLPDASLRTRKR